MSRKYQYYYSGVLSHTFAKHDPRCRREELMAGPIPKLDSAPRAEDGRDSLVVLSLPGARSGPHDHDEGSTVSHCIAAQLCTPPLTHVTEQSEESRLAGHT